MFNFNYIRPYIVGLAAYHRQFVVLCFLVVLVRANAATYYVSIDGSDIGSGSYEQPFKTIQKGQSILVPGDTLKIRKGTYYEGITLSVGGTKDSPITIMAYDGEEVVMNGSVLVSVQSGETWALCQGDDPYLKDIDGVINQNYNQIYRIKVKKNILPSDLFTMSLYEDDKQVRNAIWPNQSSYIGTDLSEYNSIPEQSNGLIDRLVDSSRLGQKTQDYWAGSKLSIHLYSTGSYLYSKMIAKSSEGEIVFDSGLDGVITSSKDRYAIINHPMLLDKPGEFYFKIDPIDSDYCWIYLWPENPENLDSRIRLTLFDYGLWIGTAYPNSRRDYIRIEGIKFINYRSSAVKFGGHPARGEYVTGGVIKNCFASAVDTAFVAEYAKNCIIEGCKSDKTVTGLLGRYGEDIRFINCENTNHTGTGVRLLELTKSRVVGTKLHFPLGPHANGMSVYQNCSKILLAYNTAYDTSITMNHTNDIIFYGNIVSSVDKWTGTYSRGYQVFINNVITDGCLLPEPLLTQERQDWPQRYVINNYFNQIARGFRMGKAVPYSYGDVQYSWYAGGLARDHNMYANLGYPLNTDLFSMDATEIDGRIYASQIDLLFKSPNSNDFSIQENSPLIGKGRNLTKFFDSKANGNSIVDTIKWDAGKTYEDYAWVIKYDENSQVYNIYMSLKDNNLGYQPIDGESDSWWLFIGQYSNPFNDFPDFDFTKDIAGNSWALTPAIGAYEYSMDKTPPQILNLQSTVVEKNVTLQWETTDDAVTSVAYWLVSSGKAAVETQVVTGDSALSTSHSIQLSGLEPLTQYAYSITCTDAYGNSATYEMPDYKFTTLAVVPVNHSPVLNPVADRSVAEAETLSLSLSASDSDGDALTYSFTAVPELTGASVNASGVFSFTPTYNTTTAAVGNKTYALTFTVSDGKGGTDNKSAILTVSNSNQTPIANAGADFTDTAASKNSSVPITLNGSASSDPDGSISTYNWVCTSGQTVAAESGINPQLTLKPGIYNFTLTVTDNEGATATDSVTVTILSPANVKPVISVIQPQTVAEGSLLTVLVSANDTDGDTLTYSSANLPSGATINEASGTINWTPSYTDASGSPYNVTVNVTDGYDIVSGSFTITVTDTNRKPVISAVGDKKVAEAAPLYFVLQSNDPDGDVVSYSATGLPAGATLNAVSGAFSWTPGYNASASSPYTVTFITSDGKVAGTSSVQSVITVTDTNQPPTLNQIENKRVAEGETLTFTLVASDGDGDSISYSCSNPPAGAILNATSGVFSWTPGYSAAGSYELSFEVVDNRDGRGSTKVSVDVINTNQPPVVTQLTNQTFAENTLSTFTLQSSDPDGDARIYTCLNIPAGAAFNSNTGEFSWKPGYDAAASSPYAINFNVSDGKDEIDTHVTVIVTDTNRNPILAAIPQQTVAENSELVFTLSATDPDNDKLTFSVNNMPEDATFNSTTGEFYWKPDYSAATMSPYDLSFTANDGKNGSASKTARIVVTNVNRAPVATLLPAQTFTEGLQGSFKIQASDPDGDKLSYTCTNLPSGASFGSTTGVLSWKPGSTASDASPYNLNFIVKDVYNSEVNTSVTLTIIDINLPPTANAVTNKAFTEGTAGTFTLTGSDPDGDDLYWECDSLPAGATLNSDNGKFDWTPGYSAAANSPYILKFTVLDGKGGSAPVDVTINVTDKNQNPVFAALPVQNFAEGSLSSFIVSATDADGDTLTYSCTNKPVGATFDTSTGTFTWTPSYTSSKATPYEYNFTVSDGWKGTASLTVKVLVSEVNQSPVFTAFTVPAFTEGVAGTFKLAASDPDGESITYSCANLPAGALLNPNTGVFTWTPSYSAADKDSYVLNFVVTDARNEIDTCQVTLVVANVNQDPAFNDIIPPVFVENVQGRFTITATDADDDIIRYSCNNLPVGAEFINTTGQFTWTPSYSAATGEPINLLFEANDGNGGKDTKTVSVMVQDTNRLPVFKNSTSYSVNTGNKLTIKVVADDLDKDDVAIACVSKPEGSVFDDADATLTWTPAKGEAGSYVAVFTASDNKGQPVSFTINILVDSVNQAPVLDPIAPLTVNEGNTLSFNAKATDINDDILTFSMEKAPASAILNPATGLFSWTPDFEAAGTYEFTIKVFDGQLYIARDVTVEVKNVNRAPVINVTGQTTVIYKDGLKLSYSATDPDGDAVSVSATGLPGNAAINRSAGSIIWSTTKSSVGSYSFIVTASDGKQTTELPVTVTIVDDQPQQDDQPKPDDQPKDEQPKQNTPPVIAAISDKVINEGESLSFAVSATDADGDNVTITATGLPSGAYFANNSFRWDNIAVLPGVYTVTFTASDGTDTVNATLSITVADVNYEPVIEKIDAQKAIVGMPIIVTINATDPDGDILTYTLKTKLDTLKIAGNVITWTPTEKYLGDNKISFSVSDGKLNVDGIFNILVENVIADSLSPEVVGLNPKPDAIQVPLNPLVLITLSDAGSGIDISTVNITMDGSTLYSGALASESEDLLYSVSGNKCSCSGTPARYVFQYQASDLFDYDYRPVITITASDLNGNVMEPYSYSFTTEMYSMCAAIPVEQVSKGKQTQQGRPDAITAPDGTIWSAWDDGSKVYLAPYYESLGRFDAAFTFNSSGKQMNPSMAVASDGAIYLAWQDNSAGNWDICIVRSVDGRNFTPTKTITSSQEDQTAPSISVDNSGNVYIAFVSDSKNTGSDICLVSANADLTSVSELVISNATGDQMAPVVTTGAGTAVVAWEDYRSGSAAVYAADSTTGWANIKLVNSGSQPDIVKDQQRSVLHTTWVSNEDIYYAEIALPLSGRAIVAKNIIDDTANLAQSSPSITHNYRNGKPRTFVAWSDSRNNEGNNDNDIYFASVHRSAGTNILATLDADMTSQGQPVMAITKDGAPYIIFQNDYQMGKAVEMACATVIKSVLEKTHISSREGGVVGTSAENINSLNDVSIKVMPGSLTTDTELTIAQVSNPPADGSGLRSLFSYDFGPSSTREFRKPVKITIPYPTTLDGSAVSVYWYNPQTGTYTQTGMSNVEVKRINGEISAISFDTTHFCQYSLSTEYIPAIITEGQ